MRDRVILMVGLYDTLDIFTYELKKEFEKIGLEVMIFNSQDMEGSMIKLSEFIKEPVKAVVTFNNLGFNMELIKGQNIWEQLQIPCINILMDHPFIHKKALDNAPANAVVIYPGLVPPFYNSRHLWLFPYNNHSYTYVAFVQYS